MGFLDFMSNAVSSIAKTASGAFNSATSVAKNGLQGASSIIQKGGALVGKGAVDVAKGIGNAASVVYNEAKAGGKYVIDTEKDILTNAQNTVGNFFSSSVGSLAWPLAAVGGVVGVAYVVTR